MDSHRTPTTDRASSAGRKPDGRGLVIALELMELGIQLAQQQITRQNPNISHSELVAKTNEWIRTPRHAAHSNTPE